MTIMQPISTVQSISVMPRVNTITDSDALTVVLRQDGNRTTETLDVTLVSTEDNYITFSFTSTILSEGETYSFKIKEDGVMIYRGKIYATSKSDFTIKHVQSVDNYTQYNNTEDTYTVID